MADKSPETKVTTYEAIIKMLGCFALVPIFTALDGMILLIAWKWFAMPIGLPPIGFMLACAILTMARFSTATMPSNPNNSISYTITFGLWYRIVVLTALFSIHLFS